MTDSICTNANCCNEGFKRCFREKDAIQSIDVDGYVVNDNCVTFSLFLLKKANNPIHSIEHWSHFQHLGDAIYCVLIMQQQWMILCSRESQINDILNNRLVGNIFGFEFSALYYSKIDGKKFIKCPCHPISMHHDSGWKTIFSCCAMMK